MGAAKDFILNNFEQIDLLKSSELGTTELVKDASKQIYIRKILSYKNRTYKVLQEIKHQNLPQIYYVAEEEERTYVIEEYINGESLEIILNQQNNLPEKQIRNIAQQLCAVLGELHKAGIIHRDIKPANIILQADGRIKLVDFGAAKLIGDKVQKQDTRILGTPGYAPPEQYGFSSTDPRSDFYAFGKTVAALAGKNYNGDLCRLIDRCTEFDPKWRVNTVAELQELLENRAYNRMMLGVIGALFIIGSGWWYFHKLPASIESVEPENISKQQTVVDVQQEKPLKKNHQESLRDNDKQPLQQEQPRWQIIDARKKQTASVDVNTDNSVVVKENTGNVINKKSTILREQVVMHSNPWSFVLDNHPNRNKWRSEAKAVGYAYLAYSTSDSPTVTIRNNSDIELLNPALTILLEGFSVAGDDLSVDSWNGRRIHTRFYAPAILGYKQVIIQLEGTIPSMDYMEFSLWGGIDGYYSFGNKPTATITIRADNLENTITQTYPIRIK